MGIGGSVDKTRRGEERSVPCVLHEEAARPEGVLRLNQSTAGVEQNSPFKITEEPPTAPPNSHTHSLHPQPSSYHLLSPLLSIAALNWPSLYHQPYLPTCSCPKISNSPIYHHRPLFPSFHPHPKLRCRLTNLSRLETRLPHEGLEGD